MKKWGIVFVLVLMLFVMWQYSSLNIFADAAKAKIALDVDQVKANFQTAVNDGAKPDDTKGWVTSLSLRKWVFMDKQIIQSLPKHPLEPAELYHYKIWTDSSGKKNLAIWARYEKAESRIYCNNQHTSDLSDVSYEDDDKAGAACEKN